uniref:Uncharacterized protein n=1 Tax=Cacopsylla melanoneura TaxID=428564 RepID=A0A8D8TFI4_9HEMI
MVLSIIGMCCVGHTIMGKQETRGIESSCFRSVVSHVKCISLQYSTHSMNLSLRVVHYLPRVSYHINNSCLVSVPNFFHLLSNLIVTLHRAEDFPLFRMRLFQAETS